MSTDREMRMGSTRSRDLVAVAVIAAIVGYLLVRSNYGRIPPLPRFAGLAAAVLGVAEAIFGHGLRARIQADRRDASRDLKPPVPPLTAARALMAAKASALAGAAVTGLWSGLLLYVLPNFSVVSAARSDSFTAAIGVVGALIMTAGALYLEYCCRAPEEPRDMRPGRL
jgi:hypothetical protein